MNQIWWILIGYGGSELDVVALNWALIRVTWTGELLMCAHMLKVAMLTGEAEEEIDGRSLQFSGFGRKR